MWTRVVPGGRRSRILLGQTDDLVLIKQFSRRALDAEPERSYDLCFIGRCVTGTLYLLPVIAECLVLVEVQVTSNEPAGRRLIVHETKVEVLPRYAMLTSMMKA